MGEVLIKIYSHMSLVPYIAIVVIILGLFMMLFSSHMFFEALTNKMHNLPSRLRRQLRAFAHEQLEENPLLASEQSALIRDLELSRLRFRGKHLSIGHVVMLSLLSSLLFMAVVLLITTRYIATPTAAQVISFVGGASKQAMEKHWEVNIPAIVQAAFIGFLAPRWLFFLGRVRSRYKYQNEAPKAFFRLSSTLRRHSNLEKATAEAVPYMPKFTQWLFIQALNHWKSRDFTSFSEVFYWVAKQSHHESWEEFASYAATASSAGVRDMIMKISILTTRAQEILNKRDNERKGIKAQIVISVIAFAILLVQLYEIIYKNPDTGVYLFITPWGKILLASVFLAVLVEISIYTWLHYQV